MIQVWLLAELVVEEGESQAAQLGQVWSCMNIAEPQVVVESMMHHMAGLDVLVSLAVEDHEEKLLERPGCVHQNMKSEEGEFDAKLLQTNYLVEEVVPSQAFA